MSCHDAPKWQRRRAVKIAGYALCTGQHAVFEHRTASARCSASALTGLQVECTAIATSAAIPPRTVWSWMRRPTPRWRRHSRQTTLAQRQDRDSRPQPRGRKRWRPRLAAPLGRALVLRAGRLNRSGAHRHAPPSKHQWLPGRRHPSRRAGSRCIPLETRRIPCR